MKLIDVLWQLSLLFCLREARPFLDRKAAGLDRTIAEWRPLLGPFVL
jgi:hypothetical protein